MTTPIDASAAVVTTEPGDAPAPELIAALEALADAESWAEARPLLVPLIAATANLIDPQE